MNNNVCNFIPFINESTSYHTINFVLETEMPEFKSVKGESVYKVHIISKGKGILHLEDKKIELNYGDLFFTFPGMPYSIEGIEDFEYMYITFLGTKCVYMILDKLGISRHNFYFTECSEMLNYWKNGIDVNIEIANLITESILLYSFYYLGNKFMLAKNSIQEINELAACIKKYIDSNYSNCNLSLELISNNLSYTPKYVSTLFKKTFKITISDYLTTLRIQHACTLIDNGFTSISNIAALCGYSDAQYFSKLFKKRTGKTPKEYIKEPFTYQNFMR